MLQFTDIKNFMEAMKKSDQSAYVKVAIVSAVTGNMSCASDDDFEGACQAFLNAYVTASEPFDFDEVAYRAQRLVDDGKYEEPNVKCFKKAILESMEYH